MDRQREAAKAIGPNFVGRRGFKRFFRPLEPQAQGKRFIFVTTFPQQRPDLIRLPPRLTNDAKRRRHLGFARLHGHQQGARKLPAPRRTIGVNTAFAAIQRDAGLGKFPNAEGGGRRAEFGNGQAEGRKFLRVVTRLEFNILEQDSVAAQGAVRAKLRDGVFKRNDFF